MHSYTWLLDLALFSSFRTPNSTSSNGENYGPPLLDPLHFLEIINGYFDLIESDRFWVFLHLIVEHLVWYEIRMCHSKNVMCHKYILQKKTNSYLLYWFPKQIAFISCCWVYRIGICIAYALQCSKINSVPSNTFATLLKEFTGGMVPTDR